MKKLLLVLLVLLVSTFIFTACGGEDKMTTTATTTTKAPATTTKAPATTTKTPVTTKVPAGTTALALLSTTPVVTSSPIPTPVTTPTVTTPTVTAPETTASEVPQTVSAQEWKDAFDFSVISKFTIEVNERCEEKEDGATEVFGVRGTIKTENNRSFYDVVEFYNDEEASFKGYEDLVVTIWDLTDWLVELHSEFEDAEDVGYSLFKYAEDKNAYYKAMDIDGYLCGVTISFTDAKLSKIEIVGQGSDYSIQCSYDFSY